MRLPLSLSPAWVLSVNFLSSPLARSTHILGHPDEAALGLILCIAALPTCHPPVMIDMQNKASAYQRPPLPSEDELEPTYVPPSPPTACETIIILLHRYHRLFAASMFFFCISILLWGGAHGINLRQNRTFASS